MLNPSSSTNLSFGHIVGIFEYLSCTPDQEGDYRHFVHFLSKLSIHYHFWPLRKVGHLLLIRNLEKITPRLTSQRIEIKNLGLEFRPKGNKSCLELSHFITLYDPIYFV